ncbi:MAG: hypothetical protein JJ979_02585 [Roseibium sp.]|nr:hypothetical protein [Roseibium sp.]
MNKLIAGIGLILAGATACLADEPPNNPDFFGMPVEQKATDYRSSSTVGSQTITTGTSDGKRFNFTTQDYGDRTVTTGTIDGKYYSRTCRRYGNNVQVCD